MPTFFDAASPQPCPPALSELLARVETLRRKSQLRPSVAPAAPWITAFGGREIAPGLLLAERRFPLWYRHEGRELASFARPQSDLLLESPAPQDVGFLCLLPAVLDDGSPRLFLATWGRIEDGQFVIRQAMSRHPGAESTLLAWLEKEMHKVDVIVGKHKAEAWLRAARTRQTQRADLPPWVDAGGHAQPNPQLSWRGLATLPRPGELYRRRRDGLLSLLVAQGR